MKFDYNLRQSVPNRKVQVLDDTYKVVSWYVLPKQFEHWLSQVGLASRRTGANIFATGRGVGHCFDWKGHGRHWRLNALGMFEPSLCHNLFDRWANSNPHVGFYMPSIKYGHEFVSAFAASLVAVQEHDLEIGASRRIDSRHSYESFLDKI